jgi:hypothetical protein
MLRTSQYVRDGAFADQNFAGDPHLIVKNDSTVDFSRRAFLYWNLMEYGGPLADAKVRLYCTRTGQAGNEHSASVVRDPNWSPNSVTWNTQPVPAPPFAYWVPEGAGFFVEFTATPEVRAALAGDRQFSICLRSVQDFGSAGDAAYASREDSDPAHRPQLILRYTNFPPSIVVPTHQIMNHHSTLGPLAVTIGAPETFAGGLVLTASSSASLVIADSDISLGGSGSNRTVTIGSGSRVGTAMITLTVNNGVQTASGSFIVNVNYVNSAPTISPIANQTTDEDTPLAVAFTISDANNIPNNLVVMASTSNDQLFPAGSVKPLAIGLSSGTGSRTLVFTSAPDLYGSAEIYVSVSDGFLVTTQTFTLTVRPVEDPPAFVRITRPRSGDNLLPGTPALLSAVALDVETNLANVQFYRKTPANRVDQQVGLATNPPYSVIWSNPPAGDSTLYAIAYDHTGLSATSAPVAVTISTPILPQPRLFITGVSNLVAVSWSASVSSNALQTTTNLAPAALWTPMESPPQYDEGAWYYLVTPTETRRFFRIAP